MKPKYAWEIAPLEKITKHGGTNYQHGCRCARCTKAWRDRARDFRNRKKLGQLKDMSQKHNRSGYMRGCRCELCKKAARDYARQRRQKTPPRD